MNIINLIIAGALASGAVGVGALRLGWRQQGWRSYLIPLGWLALGLCLYLWSAEAGAEFGASFALAWVAICAITLIALQAEYKPRREDTVATGNSFDSSTGQKWLSFIAAGPLAAIACCQLTLTVVHLLPLSLASQMAIAALLYPLLWGVAAYISCYIAKPGRCALAFIILACLSTGIIIL